MTVPAALPLPTLLSQALVAFTIEFDNAYEQRMPHRTVTGPAAQSRVGPWLASQAMWANFMRLVDRQGTPLDKLKGAARITNLDGVRRWGYVAIADGIVRPTRWGMQAQEIWRPITAEIEARWSARFGNDELVALRAALAAVAQPADRGTPAYLPVVRYAFRTEPLPQDLGGLPPDDLSALLSRVLLAFTIEYEQDHPITLPAAADGLRVLGETAIPQRDLPRLTGVSRAAIAMLAALFARHGIAAIEPAPGRGKALRLTAKGMAAKRAYVARLAELEARWRQRHGERAIEALRAPLARINPRLVEGLEPPPNSWRGAIPRPETLPHHPMVLHRGGYPDGA
jgi:hypothetical protein